LAEEEDEGFEEETKEETEIAEEGEKGPSEAEIEQQKRAEELANLQAKVRLLIDR
jgi:hypothetical protein